MSTTTEVQDGGPKGDWVNQDESDGATKRDFIHLLAVGMTAGAVVGILVPTIGQMAPDAAVRALASKEVDISGVEPGMAMKTMWRGKPVFIRRLTEQEKATAQETSLSALKDDQARNENVGSGEATLENRAFRGEYVIVIGVCTHLGCVPLGTGEGENRGDYGGWFCPCHGSHYDRLGRARKGPAPENLPIPPVEFLTDTSIRLG